jgi:guanine nucleotide-binding protein G(I)/G(S)/G(T) subunit beta-1
MSSVNANESVNTNDSIKGTESSRSGNFDLGAAQAEAEGLRDRIRGIKEQMNDTNLLDYSVANQVPPLGRSGIKSRRTLRGHLGKIYAVQAAPDEANSSAVISASQDGRLIIWDGSTGDKSHAIPLKSSWVMSCALSSKMELAASGGLDNVCTVYRIADVDRIGDFSRGAPAVGSTAVELEGHSGFVSGIRFFEGNEAVLTASGDTTCILWDLATRQPRQTFRGHNADVMGIDLQPSNPANCFVSVSSDTTARFWDIRTGRTTRIFVGHDSDINGVNFFPDGNAFITASDDGTCRLFDLRADREVSCYASPDIMSPITSVAFSKSGRIFVAGCDDANAYVWDTLRGERYAVLSGHESRITSVGVSCDGNAIYTASWDAAIKVWV